ARVRIGIRSRAREPEVKAPVLGQLTRVELLDPRRVDAVVTGARVHPLHDRSEAGGESGRGEALIRDANLFGPHRRSEDEAVGSASDGSPPADLSPRVDGGRDLDGSGGAGG